jgi:hypothetical protein
VGEWVSEQANSQQPAEQQIPEGVIVGKNGVWIDAETRKFIKGGKPTTVIETTSQATALATTRWQQAREQAAEAGQIGLARISTDGKWTSALADIAQKQAELAMDPDAGRASTEAARYVRDTATGHWFTGGNNGSSGGSGLQINVSETGLQRLIGLLEGRMDAGQSDNATVIDVESE